jgi:hypothetical protein
MPGAQGRAPRGRSVLVGEILFDWTAQLARVRSRNDRFDRCNTMTLISGAGLPPAAIRPDRATMQFDR